MILQDLFENGIQQTFVAGNKLEIEMALMNIPEADKYPVLCLEMPYSYSRLGVNPYRSYRDVRLILATITEAEYRNKQRKAITFEPILIPFMAEVKEVIAKGSIAYDVREVTYFPYFHEDSQNVNGDFWDAIVIRIDITLPDLNKC